MNWKQLYTTSTEEERLHTLLHMLHAIEARQTKIIFTGNHIVRNRRRTTAYHIIGERRGRHLITRIASTISILASLLCVFIFATLTILYTPSHIAVQILFFPITSLLAIIAFKPKQKRKITIFS